jgi:phosphoribosyl-ATP pyrophosphohydrolase/phosphoribosyl-AMP cyclohydrolase
MELKFDKAGLIPAVIQDAITKNVLMLGYMNQEAYEKTIETSKVTFFSRSKDSLWTKGESSGNFLNLVSIVNDCDSDSLLVQVRPEGPTCHKGTTTCWGNAQESTLEYLENTIQKRKENLEDDSYVSSLFKKGMNKIAQKVGEEAVEVVIEAKDDNDDLFIAESADLYFHYLILLQAKGFKMATIFKELEKRRK